ncbi:LysR substrate-binding domain-containing protein [Zobellella sp. DQSA1]|uniref:LysR substrate-binding domain-containing protein n=1 Tax=Zobellella sp. DQSA1 TaxID=3342386 RepID=UPI0035BF835F
MPASPPLNALRAFEAAARLSSFSAAAGELHLTAAAISHRIKELERALGVPLFVRRARGVSLTEAGRHYQARIADAFRIITSATTELNQPPLAGPLVLSLPHGFCRHWLLPRLTGLLERHPGLRLTLKAEDRLTDLRSGQVDLAIRFGAGGYLGLHTELLLKDAITVLAASRLLDGHPHRSTGDWLAATPLLDDIGIRPTEPWSGWSPWLREAGVEATGLIGVTDAGLALDACRQRLGLCLGRWSLAQPLLQAGELRPLLPWRGTDFAYYLLSRPGEEDNPRIRALRLWLREQAALFAREPRPSP